MGIIEKIKEELRKGKSIEELNEKYVKASVTKARKALEKEELEKKKATKIEGAIAENKDVKEKQIEDLKGAKSEAAKIEIKEIVKDLKEVEEIRENTLEKVIKEIIESLDRDVECTVTIKLTKKDSENMFQEYIDMGKDKFKEKLKMADKNGLKAYAEKLSIVEKNYDKNKLINTILIKLESITKNGEVFDNRFK